jgi:GNAT superfamily N-acetyltransferase
VHTHFLSDAVVTAYLRDLAVRLHGLGDSFPLVWVSLGTSGDKIVEALLDIYIDLHPEDVSSGLEIVRVYVERGSGIVKAREEERSDFLSSCADGSVLLVDGPIHSGSSMLAAADWLTLQGAKSVISYGLVVKRTSDFIPTFFGLMIQEHDRALFQLDRMPNNRILKKSSPYGALRAISERDIKRSQQTLSTDVESISKITLADLWYAKRSRGDYVYVYEIGGQIAGFIHFYKKGIGAILIDVVAVDNAFQNAGVAGLLMRWAENWARCHNMTEIQLYAIAARVGMYEKLKYLPTGESSLDLGCGESYTPMKRRILYNIDPEDRLRFTES